MPYVCTMYKSVYGGAIFIATKILLYSASSTSCFSLIMEIPKERDMERSRDVGDAGRCLKQPSKRIYGAKKKRFAGKPKQNRWSFTQEATPVSVSKEGRHVEGYRLLNVNILKDMAASLSCSRMFRK